MDRPVISGCRNRCRISSVGNSETVFLPGSFWNGGDLLLERLKAGLRRSELLARFNCGGLRGVDLGSEHSRYLFERVPGNNVLLRRFGPEGGEVSLDGFHG